jgi:hypothetical protein
MTRTEDRLTDALTAAVSGLHEDTLRPLAAPARRDRRWTRWLAPAAAAAAVTLVVSLAAVLTGQSPTAPGPAVGTPGIPRYYAEMDFHGKAVVRSTATGAVTDSIPVPSSLGFADASEGNITASAGGVFFAAAFASQFQQRIYRFEITSAGKVSGFSLVPDSAMPSQVAAMAASPDGSELAIAVQPGRLSAAEIVVINTATGTHRVWRGGLARRGYRNLDINGLSWTSDQRELVFSAQLCWPDKVNSPCGIVSGEHRAAEVRTLNMAAGGGRLDSGRVLLRQSARYPYIASAAISPDGATITALVLHGPARVTISGAIPDHLSVVQISATTGQQLRVLYQRPTGPTLDWYLSPDASARHWLLDGVVADGPPGQSEPGFNGWIGNGQLHRLQPAGGYLAGEAW